MACCSSAPLATYLTVILFLSSSFDFRSLDSSAVSLPSVYCFFSSSDISLFNFSSFSTFLSLASWVFLIIFCFSSSDIDVLFSRAFLRFDSIFLFLSLTAFTASAPPFLILSDNSFWVSLFNFPPLIFIFSIALILPSEKSTYFWRACLVPLEISFPNTLVVSEAFLLACAIPSKAPLTPLVNSPQPFIVFLPSSVFLYASHIFLPNSLALFPTLPNQPPKFLRPLNIAPPMPLENTLTISTAPLTPSLNHLTLV